MFDARTVIQAMITEAEALLTQHAPELQEGYYAVPEKEAFTVSISCKLEPDDHADLKLSTKIAFRTGQVKDVNETKINFAQQELFDKPEENI